MTGNLIIRNECAPDYETVERITREAFYNIYRPGCVEHRPSQDEFFIMSHSSLEK